MREVMYGHRKYLGIIRTETGDRMQEIEALERVPKWAISLEDRQLLNRIKRRIQDEIWLTSGKTSEQSSLAEMAF